MSVSDWAGGGRNVSLTRGFSWYLGWQEDTCRRCTESGHRCARATDLSASIVAGGCLTRSVQSRRLNELRHSIDERLSVYTELLEVVSDLAGL